MWKFKYWESPFSVSKPLQKFMLSFASEHKQSMSHPLVLPGDTFGICSGNENMEWPGMKGNQRICSVSSCTGGMTARDEHNKQKERKDEINEVTAFTVITAATWRGKNNQVLLIPHLFLQVRVQKTPVSPISPDPGLR